MNNIDNNIQTLKEEYPPNASNDLISTFIDMLRLMKKSLANVLTVIIIFAVTALGASVIMYEPLYKTNVTFSITPLVLSDSQSGLSVYKFNYVFSFAEQMNDTFPHIVNSNILKNSIEYDLERPMNGKIIPEPVLGSNIFKVTVESNSPKDANDIMNSFIKCYPNIAEHIIGDTRIKVIHTNGMPTKPVNPRNHLLHTLLGAIIGLVSVMAVYFIYAQYRETVKDKNDISTKLNSNYICEIPHVNKKRTSNNTATLLKMSAKTPGFSEAVRVLKKRVKALLRDNEKVIAITSTAGGEGKTTIAYNLAAALANGNDRTLLVDMNFINRTLQNQLLKDPNKCVGITDVANKKAELQKAICNISQSFDILFAGSENCKFNNLSIPEIFDSLRKEYDYIIIDTPPCGIVSDVGIVANLCDNIIFSVKSDTTSISSIKKALQYILYSRARLIGFVINDGGHTTGEYGGKMYYSHYKRYGYHYRYNHGYGVDSVKPEK